MTKKLRRDGEGHNIDETGVDARAASELSADGDRNDNDSTSSTGRSGAGEEKQSISSSWPVALYIPNLIGYLRIIFSFLGLRQALGQRCRSAFNTWVAAAFLDLIDGMAARKLNQSSQLGVYLDIMADNILRSVVWITATIESSKYDPSEESEICLWAVAIVCLEWITMFCSQSNHKNQKGDDGVHWKDVERKTAETAPPFWVQAVFRNNFCSLPGVLAIYGLFVAPLGTYVWYADRTRKATWPSRLLSERNISMLLKVSYAGRFLSAAVELWLCYDFFRGVIARDRWQSTKQKDS